MKKHLIKLFTVFLTVFILSQSSIPVYSSNLEPDYDYDTKVLCYQGEYLDEYSYTVDVLISKYSDTNEGILIVAFYLGDGRFVETRHYSLSEHISIKKGETKTFSTDTFTFSKPIHDVKVMIWDDFINATPLAEVSGVSFLENTIKSNYAIVEKYVDVSEVVNATSEYDYLQVVTLDGEKKTLYVDDSPSVMNAISNKMSNAGIGTSQAANARIDIANRVIEYSVKASTGRVNNLAFASATKFSDCEYSSITNKLYKFLASDVTVLDATEYDIDSPSTNDYRASSLSEILEDVDYSGFLIRRNNNYEYEHLVITRGDFNIPPEEPETPETYSTGYAIVEKYVDVSEIADASSEYDYLQVVTLDGEKKTLYIDDKYATMSAVADEMEKVGISANQKSNARIEIANRVIEYSVKSSNCRVDKIRFVAAEKFLDEYSVITNKLSKYLSSDVTVLDATEYVYSDSPSSNDYRASSLSELIDGNDYEGFLVHKNDDGTYEHLVITCGILNITEEPEVPETYTTGYAIVEKYVDVSEIAGASSEYDYLQVVTLDGEKNTLYVDDNYATMTAVANEMEKVGIGANQKNNAKIEIAKRVIEYSAKFSNGRVNSVVFVPTTVFISEYNKTTNTFWKPLSSTATVLDATEYVSSDSPSSNDYKPSSLSKLSLNPPETEYEGFLVHENVNGTYEHVVITKKGQVYGTTSNFAVAAATASTSTTALLNGEEVYTLRVMKDGLDSAVRLPISPDAVIYNGHNLQYSDDCATAIKKGSAFFYTTDKYGLVDRIDVVFDGGYNFDGTSPSKLNVRSPAKDSIKASDWYIEIDEDHVSGDNPIQLFVAPVVVANNRGVAFSKFVDDVVDYIDVEITYDYPVAQDANIYYYDLSDWAPVNYTAFSSGEFKGIDLSETDDGRAYLGSWDSYDFDGLVQWAFVMVSDGVVTNALIIGK